MPDLVAWLPRSSDAVGKLPLFPIAPTTCACAVNPTPGAYRARLRVPLFRPRLVAVVSPPLSLTSNEMFGSSGPGRIRIVAGWMSCAVAPARYCGTCTPLTGTWSTSACSASAWLRELATSSIEAGWDREEGGPHACREIV